MLLFYVFCAVMLPFAGIALIAHMFDTDMPRVPPDAWRILRAFAFWLLKLTLAIAFVLSGLIATILFN
jgi:hypothetical protein